MPPVTSPRRTAMHPTPSLARPMAIPTSTTSPLATLGNTPSSAGTSPNSIGSFNRQAPYMVALAGWPEPVFVAEARETWEMKHSRPPSPTGFRDIRDGIGGFSIPSFGHQQSQVREFRDGVSVAPRIPPSFQRETRETPSTGTAPSRLPPLGAERRDGIGASRSTPPTTTHPAYAATRNSAVAASMARTTSSNMAIDSAMRSGHSSPLRSSSSPDAPSPPSHSSSHHHSQSHSRSSSQSANPTPGGLSGGSGSGSALQQAQAQATAAATAAARHRRAPGSFVDPRYAPNAPIIGSRRTGMRVAPAWTTSPHQGPGHSASHGHGHNHVHAHAHGSQPYPSVVPRGGGAAGLPGRGARGAAHGVHHLHIQRSVPEVWPPPKGVPSAVATGQSPHLATAVYPRDPDSPWMWSMSTPSAGASPHTHPTSAPHTPRTPSAGSVSPASIPSPKPERETDDRDFSRHHIPPDVKPLAQNGSNKERERECERESGRQQDDRDRDHTAGTADLRHYRESRERDTEMDVDDA